MLCANVTHDIHSNAKSDTCLVVYFDTNTPLGVFKLKFCAGYGKVIEITAMAKYSTEPSMTLTKQKGQMGRKGEREIEEERKRQLQTDEGMRDRGDLSRRPT